MEIKRAYKQTSLCIYIYISMDLQNAALPWGECVGGCLGTGGLI